MKPKKLTFVIKFCLESNRINHFKFHVHMILSIKWPVSVLAYVHRHQVHVCAECESGQEFDLIEAKKSLTAVKKLNSVTKFKITVFRLTLIS